ncbi:MAG: TetR/AcrR family transcriptional regulator [Pseudomonadota bacterium]
MSQTSPSQPGRPREFNEGEALDRILSVFWEKGYEGTSLADLVDATGVRKASLYKSFGNKRQMYIKALEAYESRAIDQVCDELERDGAALKKLDWFLSLPGQARWQEGDARGCFLCNASADQAAFDPEISKIVRNGQTKLSSAIELALGSLPKQPRQDATKATADFFLGVYTGLRILARGGADIATLDGIRMQAMTTVRA